jgi:hypothetical protein
VDGFEAVGATDAITVNAPVAGPYNVRLHYANSANSLGQQATQTLSVLVNGTFVTQISMPDMGSWDYWGDVTSVLNLNAGSNTITYTYRSSDSAHVNLDYIAVEPAPLHYEAESLTVAAHSSADTVTLMSNNQLIGGSGSQLNGSAVGSFVTYSVNVPQARTYDVKLRVKKWNNRGIFQFATAPSTGGTYTNWGGTVDLYDPNQIYTMIDLGQVTFASASSTTAFRFTMTGKNSGSTAYDTAIDYIVLIPN